MRNVDEIIIHCAATRPSMDIGVKEIRQWHTDQGWSDIGYHFVIRRNGVIENGRDLDINGAHTKGHNNGTIGICMVGGIDDNGIAQNNFTEKQFNSLDDLLKKLLVDYNIKRISAHYDYAPKACPSFNVENFLKEKGIHV